MGDGWVGRAQWQARARSGMDVQGLRGERQVSLADGSDWVGWGWMSCATSEGSVSQM